MKRTPAPTATLLLALVLLAFVPLQAHAQSSQPKTLYDAASQGDLEQLNTHIGKGVDLDQPNRRGQTALGLAVQSRQTEAVTLLVTSGADVDTPSGGVPPLITAVLHRRSDIISFLIDKGANINVADSSGRTALLVATESAQTELVKALVAKGADVNAKDNRGQTPLTIAKRGRYTDIATFLEQNGAEEPVIADDRDPYGRLGFESAPGAAPPQSRSRYQSSAQPSVLADPNAIRENIALYPGLSATLEALDANAVSVGRSWASRRADNRTTLIRAVAKQVTSELTFVTALATAEKATVTVEAIAALGAKRAARYQLIGSELRGARRLAQQEARTSMTRGRGRSASRGGRGSNARSQGPDRYGDPAQMADPYGAPPMRGSRRSAATEEPPEQALAPETQTQLDAWLKANPEDKRDLLGAVHELDLLEYEALHQVALEEEAKKTAAALKGLMLFRQIRLARILVKMAADDERLQRMAQRYGPPAGAGRGRRGPTMTQQGEQTTSRRRKRSH